MWDDHQDVACSGNPVSPLYPARGPWDMNVDDRFRTRLKEEMEAQGFNPASLSVRAGLNRRAVTDILSGAALSPRISTAFKLAKALNLSLDELLSGRRPVTIAPGLAELLANYDIAQQERIADVIRILRKAPSLEKTAGDGKFMPPGR